MRRALGTTLATVVAATVVLSGCSSDEPDSGGATVPRESPTTLVETTTSTTPEQRYAIPAEITVEYVNDVMAALNKVYGDVVRKWIETRTFEVEDLVPLRAVYLDPELQQQAEAIAKSPPRPREEYRAVIGDRRITVDALLTVSDACIAFRGTYDFSALSESAAAPSPGWVTLRRKPDGADPRNLNPTPWAVAAESNSEENGCGG